MSIQGFKILERTAWVCESCGSQLSRFICEPLDLVRVINVDVPKAIRLCVDSGKVALGAKNSLKACLRGEPKLVVLAANTPKDTGFDLRRAAAESGVALLEFNGSSLDLGIACGKPFPVSVLAVFEAGDSEILNAVKE